MDNIFIYIIVAFFILLALDFITRKLFTNKESAEIKKSTYRYFAKNAIMTERENKFFKQLNEILGNKWFVIPQVHLSALLNHKVKGQNWKAAFRHINGKSVDYVLLSKETMKPICAIELDDSTHNHKNRVERDAEVERIFAEAKLPLARFKNPEKLSRQDIVNTIVTAIKKVQ